MKTKSYLIVFLLPLMSGTCKKESENCHHDILVKNSTSSTVLYAQRITTGVSSVRCMLEGYNLAPDETVKYDLRYCWEDELSKGKTFELFIVDPKQYNQPNVFYSCDSIGIKNKVLKHYVLTLEDLRRSDFIVTYQ